MLKTGNIILTEFISVLRKIVIKTSTIFSTPSWMAIREIKVFKNVHLKNQIRIKKRKTYTISHYVFSH